MTDTQQPPFDKMAAMIKSIGVGMLTTEGATGSAMRSRPMQTQGVADGSLWFFTRVDSPKVAEVEAAHAVNVSYADPNEHVYVSVSGMARTIKNPQKLRELWTAAAARWFPGGPNDPKTALLQVEIQSAEFWDTDAREMQSLIASGAKGEELAQATDNRKLS